MSRIDTVERATAGAARSPWTFVPEQVARVLQAGPGTAASEQWPLSDRTERLLVSPDFPPFAREQYNKLASTLHQAQLDRGVKVVLLTSALPAEGKTLTAANLALALSESHGRRVLLVDADLRHPSLHELFGVANVPGLSDSLDVEGSLPVILWSSRLSLLTAGDNGGDPMKTLTSDRMRTFIDDTRRAFDWVLIDAAPVGLLTDARLLASMADVALLVALAGKTPYDAIQNAAAALGPERLAGVVLNRVADAALPHSRYHDYYKGRRT